MTALILKDIATLKKTLLLTITLCIALIVYGVYENEIFMMRYRYKDGYWYLSGYVSNKQLREQGIIQ